MANFKVYLYKNTGFNISNCPDDLNRILTYGGNRLIRPDDIYRLQPYLVDSIRVKGSFQNLQGVDYCILSSTDYENIGYFIINNKMINENVAELVLLFDAVATIGLGYNNKYSILGGWAIRRHYTQAEDTLFANILPESFSPSQAVKSEVFEVGFNDERTHLIASTVNISDQNGELKLGIDKLNMSGAIIVKPIIANASRTTKVTLPENKTVGGIEQAIQCLAIYDANDLNDDVFNKLNAYGLINVITASYSVPTELLSVSSKDSGGFYNAISGSGRGITTSLKFEYTTAKNKKVFALGSQFIFMSVISGDTASFQPWEIVTTGFDNLRVNLMADLTPAGRTYLRPEFYRGYKGEKMTSYFKTVMGSCWNNVPIITTGQNGWAFNQQIEQVNNSIAQQEKAGLSARMTGEMAGLNFQSANSDYSTRRNTELYNMEKTARSSRNNGALYNQALSQDKQLTSANLFDSIGAWGNQWILQGGNKVKNQELGAVNVDLNYLALQQATTNQYYNLLNNIATQENVGSQMDSVQGIYSAQMNIINLQRAKELIKFNSSNMVVAPNYSFANSSGLQNFLGNGFVIIQEQLHPNDVKRFDNYLTLFGYSVDEELKIEHFKNRPLYNFVQTSFIKIKNNSGNLPTYLLDSLENILMSGVRIWHTFPNDVTEEELYNNF